MQPFEIPFDNQLLGNKIYHYTSVEGCKHILSQRMLKLSPASTFNDPFDINPGLLTLEIRNENKKAFITQIKERNNIDETNKKLDDVLMDNQEFSNFHFRQITQMLSSFKVACFSASNDNVLLWSHYAQKHTGVCLQFEIQETNPNKIMAAYRKVNYSEFKAKSYPYLDEFASRQVLLEVCFQKSNVWSYEQEIRAVSIMGQPNELYSPFETIGLKLTGVCFGCKCDNNTILVVKRLLNINQPYYQNVNLFRVLMVNGKYELEIKEMKH